MAMAACKPSTPEQYIQPGKMEDILVDYHLARAMAQQAGGSQARRDYNQALYVDAVLKKHGVTKADFDSSLVYYYTRSDRFVDVYQRVADRLEEQALALGATEGDIGKYAVFNTTGDTANIWPDRSMAILMPMPPYNLWEFNIDADTTYRRGDALMMQFVSDYMFQSGTKAGILYFAVFYEDTVVCRNLRFTVSGLNQLRVPADDDRVPKAIRGYFFLGQGNELTTTTRLLFLNNVQLIRFHTQHEENSVPTDSIPRDSVGGRFSSDSLGGRDSVRRGLRVVSSN